jgi:hypothetical protein
MATHKFLDRAQANIVEVLKRKQEKVVAMLKSFREKGTQKLGKVLESVQVAQEHDGPVSQGYTKGAKFGFALDISAAMVEEADIDVSNPTKTELVKHLQEVEKTLPPSKRSDAAIRSLSNAKTYVIGSKIGHSILGALLKTARFLFKYLALFVEQTLDATLLCVGALIQLIWFIMTIPLKIPVFHGLYRMLISNCKFMSWNSCLDQYEPTLLSLLTLGPSIVFTYGYMWSHDLYEPFPEFPVIPDYGYPDDWNEEKEDMKEVHLFKRGNSLQFRRPVAVGRRVVWTIIAIEALMVAYMITYLTFYGLIALLLSGPIGFLLILFFLLF